MCTRDCLLPQVNLVVIPTGLASGPAIFVAVPMSIVLFYASAPIGRSCREQLPLTCRPTALLLGAIQVATITNSGEIFLVTALETSRSGLRRTRLSRWIDILTARGVSRATRATSLTQLSSCTNTKTARATCVSSTTSGLSFAVLASNSLRSRSTMRRVHEYASSKTILSVSNLPFSEHTAPYSAPPPPPLHRCRPHRRRAR